MMRRIHSPRTASVLILVLVVIALLTLASASLFDRMFAELRGARTHGRRLDAVVFAESGVEYAKALLLQDTVALRDLGGLYDNPNRMQAVIVSDSDIGALRGKFSIVAPVVNYEGYFDGWRSGLEDESSKWNLNTLPLLDEYEEGAGRAALMKLPGMTESIADAILDFVDADTDARMLGAEQEHYSSLNPPYEPKNGPLESVDQLLLVRDVTPQLLFGADVNRNGSIEPEEELLAQNSGTPLATGRGWSSYLTVYSAERNVRPDGSLKINVNGEDLQELHRALREVLDESQANFIVAYRQGGAYDGDERGESAGSIRLDFQQPGGTNIGSLLELVGAKTQLPSEGASQNGAPPGGTPQNGGSQGGGSQTIVESPFADDSQSMRTYLPTMLDNLTVVAEPTIPGRLNVNQAPRVVLEGIPELTLNMVDSILSRRDMQYPTTLPEHGNATWLLVEQIVDLDTMKRVMPLLNAGGSVFRGQFIGFYEAEGPAMRLEAVIDATEAVPIIRQWRDLRELGPGYSLETLNGTPVGGS